MEAHTTFENLVAGLGFLLEPIAAHEEGGGPYPSSPQAKQIESGHPA